MKKAFLIACFLIVCVYSFSQTRRTYATTEKSRCFNNAHGPATNHDSCFSNPFISVFSLNSDSTIVSHTVDNVKYDYHVTIAKRPIAGNKTVVLKLNKNDAFIDKILWSPYTHSVDFI
jgi:hypothetical protein